MKIFVLLISLQIISVALTASIYKCIQNSFNQSCKTKLYACTNDPFCSYQLNQNTQHIFLNQNSTNFPSLYFSNPIARTLYECLKVQCQLPDMDQNYPKQLPFDYCLMQVYDTCGGNIEQIYTNPKSSASQAQCYKKYCKFPQISAQ